MPVPMILTVVAFRNMYYKDPLLFKKQAVVDRYVDILAYTFGMQRSDLNIVGRIEKGLIASSNSERRRQQKVWSLEISIYIARTALPCESIVVME